MIETINFIFKLLLGPSSTGVVNISSNVDEVCIKTGWTPEKVFISIDKDGETVCGSSSNWIDIKIVPLGFVIKSKIQGNFRKITWIATK